MPRRVLSIATLYPNAVHPRFGTFVARSLEALAARGDWAVTVINPVGIPPVPFGRYRSRPGALAEGLEHGVRVFRPRFTLIPRLTARNPAAIVKAALPLARKLHAEAPFDLVDAQFFYPDGPAAARIAADLGLPLSIKARGADIHHWGTQPNAGRQMPRDPEAIAEAVKEILTHRAPPERVAENAASFSWEANAAALAAYYESLLA